MKLYIVSVSQRHNIVRKFLIPSRDKPKNEEEGERYEVFSDNLLEDWESSMLELACSLGSIKVEYVINYDIDVFKGMEIACD